MAGTKQLSELIEVKTIQGKKSSQNRNSFTLDCVKVDGPADVTITSGMPDAERKERQVNWFSVADS